MFDSIVTSYNEWRFCAKVQILISETKKNAPSTADECIAKLKEIPLGWIKYFRMRNTQSELSELDGELNNRLRIAFGMIGRNPNRVERILFASIQPIKRRIL